MSGHYANLRREHRRRRRTALASWCLYNLIVPIGALLLCLYLLVLSGHDRPETGQGANETNYEQRR